jgi:ABC-2 type transport system ATP-binding protein
MIELRNVRKWYGEVKAVDGVSFTARPGEIFGLIGPNGAGKSTTIKMIMNILAPDSGEILFDGRRLGKRDKDTIGYLPEERGLYKKVKLGEMLAYLASLKNANPAEAARRIDRWLARFDLAEWKNRRCEDLSKGMGQKAQFIAAVAHDPPYLFLDEPFAGLDPVATDILRETVLEMGREGKTILFSTHNMEVAERICSRIFLIDHGREVLSGAMDEVKVRYGRNAVLAEFDGELDLKGLSGLAANIIRYPRYVEIELAAGVSSQDLLKELAARVTVRRFEVASPSLHKIFVQLVGRGRREAVSNE